MGKKDTLESGFQAPLVKSVGEAIREATEVLSFGSSIASWERRATASAEASRRRRVDSNRRSLLTRALIVAIPVGIVFCIVGFLFLLKVLQS